MNKNKSKKILRTVTRIMPHVSIICAAMALTFLMIEIFNPYASFISHTLSKQAVLPIWIFSSVWTAVAMTARIRRGESRELKNAKKPDNAEKSMGNRGIMEKNAEKETVQNEPQPRKKLKRIDL